MIGRWETFFPERWLPGAMATGGDDEVTVERGGTQACERCRGRAATCKCGLLDVLAVEMFVIVNRNGIY